MRRAARRFESPGHVSDDPSSRHLLAKLHDSPQLRVIGVDGRVGPLIESAIDQLCGAGFIDGPACDSLSLAYETTDNGAGWFYFHHHHLHMSILDRASAGLSGAMLPPPRGMDACLGDTCMSIDPQLDPRRSLSSVMRPRKIAR